MDIRFAGRGRNGVGVGGGGPSYGQRRQSPRPIPRMPPGAGCSGGHQATAWHAAAAEACEAAASTLRVAARRVAHRGADAADHSHRAVRRSPRGPHARFHAAGRSAGRLSESGRRRRRHGRGDVHAGDDRGLPAAVGLPSAVFQGNARSGRDRGQPATVVELEGARRQHDDAL